MTKVVVSGAHRVGKSTVISDLLERLPDAVGIGNILRQLERDGYGIRSRTDPRTLAAYLSRQTADEDLCSGVGHLISDRAFVDAVAYVQANTEAGISRHSWSAEDVMLLKAVARLHARRFDLHVYIPIEFPMDHERPDIEGSEHFRRLVDECIRDLLSDAWPIPVVTIAGTRSDRMERLIASIKAHCALPR